MTIYFFLISISNCSLDFLSIRGDRNTIYKTRDSGDQKIESLCVSRWSLLYNFFLAYTSSCSIDQKLPAAPQNGPNHHPSRLSIGVLIRLFPSLEIQFSTDKDLLIPRGRAGLEASYLSPISPPFLLLVREVAPFSKKKVSISHCRTPSAGWAFAFWIVFCPMSMWYPPVFGSHWVYLVYRSTTWQQEKKAIFCYTPVISFVPSHANPHRVLDQIP